MTGGKRPRPAPDRHVALLYQAMPSPPRKRQRLIATPTAVTGSNRPRPDPRIPPSSGHDLLSPLSDELLLRILSFLPLQHLLAVAPISRRLYQLSCDSQLWKALYYARFVLPRAMRIPGFREGVASGNSGFTPGTSGTGAGTGTGHKLHYSGRRALWADGRRGGVVMRDDGKREAKRRRLTQADEVEQQDAVASVNWKKQYKTRHNWARGKCAVEELKLGGEAEGEDGTGRMLVKVVEGVAVTADKLQGLRAWDLRSRRLIAQVGVGHHRSAAAPSCIAVDDAGFERGVLDVALGFDDGSFGIWRLSTTDQCLAQRYRHEKSSNGTLIAMAFSYPYLLTATQTVLVSLYTFEVPRAAETGQERREATAQTEPEATDVRPVDAVDVHTTQRLSAPYLLTSLDSHTSRPPLALSIRRAGKRTVASVAYTFSTRRGWSIGIQDLHIHKTSTNVKSVPEITATRIAYTTPVETGGVSHSTLTTPAAIPQRSYTRGRAGPPPPRASPAPCSAQPEAEPGPTTLCYNHPYLLATVPDNTLILHVCTSTASSLSISDGIRLWGHTSGISDAEITARGKAVSVSTRGEEMRVWELEGRSAGVSGGSVEIRPWQAPAAGKSAGSSDGRALLHAGDPAHDWDERRNWVGFDDEMVIVLKERKGARESLMVYDFT